MLRKITYGITGYLLLAELVWLTGVWEYVHYLFPPAVYLISGAAAVVLAVILAVTVIGGIVRKQVRFWDVGMLVLNLQYLVFYLHMLSMQ